MGTALQTVFKGVVYLAFTPFATSSYSMAKPRVHNSSIERECVNSLYLLQTHCVKDRMNTFWCHLDRHFYKQALLLFIEKNASAWFLHYFEKVFVNETQVYLIPAPLSNNMYKGKR